MSLSAYRLSEPLPAFLYLHVHGAEEHQFATRV
jgi:hypothetical protein